MNVVSTLDKIAAQSTEAPRAPPKAVKCLLPIWGFKYVRQFLNVGLPTWLAPGNLPALAAALPTEFIILTSREDEVYLTAHPAFRRLCNVCDVSVQYIDHLITGTNYSTTITLSYLEAVRATGEEMTDTCFFFLVSDYVVANNSFANVLKRMMSGTSGVLVGNFQVVEEEARPWLEERIARSPDVLNIPARDLVRWGLSHLHPATVANTVNFAFNHNDHTNRLFWRVDNQTLIGRFYLMHMICIRPELTDFTIGSSCDYSFIPEMCPSDAVDVITDSDEYLVVEMQPRQHEAYALRLGRQTPAKLAASLGEWTTASHRANSKTSVVFHSGDIPERTNVVLKEAEMFVSKVANLLPPKPRPHRLHPYWDGAIASYHEATGSRLTDREWRLALGLPNAAWGDSKWVDGVFASLGHLMFGKPPHVRPWHPRRPDFDLILNQLRDHHATGKSDTKLLLVADRPTIFTTSLPDGGERVLRIRTSQMNKHPLDYFDPLNGRFDVCLVELGEEEFDRADEIIDRIAPLMAANGSIMIAVSNQQAGSRELEFNRSISTQASRFIRPSAKSTVFRFVPANKLRWRSLRDMMNIARNVRTNPKLHLPRMVVLGPFLAIGAYIGNRLTKPTIGIPPKGIISSMLLTIKVDHEEARKSYQYSSNRILRERNRRRNGYPDKYKLPQMANIASVPSTKFLLTGQGEGVITKHSISIISHDQTDPQTMMTTPPPAQDGTREPQYNRCIEIKNRQGLTSLGLMTNQVWEDDPRRLAFLLARYKFVSKMLTGKKFVGELGCGDAFGTRIVMQSVDKVVAYDFDQVFIDDIRQRRSEAWPVEVHYQDIIENPLPNKHDGIYSLDVIEHISPMDEHTYITHLVSSLTEDGVLIIGSPSLESQPYASPPSKEGHINCKSGSELKALLHNYFHNVFLFSMNDEVVHTGYSPMAHYLFAVCCQPKS